MEAGLSLPPIGYYVGGEKKWVKEKDARHDFRPESKEGEDMDLGGGEEWFVFGFRFGFGFFFFFCPYLTIFLFQAGNG